MKLVDIFESVELVNESFKDAANIFSKQADPTVVKFYLNKFRELSNKNIINGPEKDITTWVKQGFDKFKNFVAIKAQGKSNKEKKASSKMEGAIKVAEYRSWTVIAPLTAAASCQYGAGTQWCTAGREDNKFDQYFHNDNITLYYLIEKNGNSKYALAYDRADDVIDNIYDEEDNTIDIIDLETITGIADIEEELHKWNSKFKPNQPKTRTMDERIKASSPSDALDLFLEKYDDLSSNQLDELRNKITTDIDTLSEYCLAMKNNQDDPLFIKAPEIMLTSMLKHRLEFNYYTAHLEDWVKMASNRSTAIEKLLPKLAQELKSNGGSMYQPAVDRIAQTYAFKHWDTEAAKSVYNRLTGNAS